MVVLGPAGLGAIARPIVASLDLRYGWNGSVPVPVQLGALVVAASAYGLGVWAISANAYFSKVVRIQNGRGQTVATGGPYRFVRHPGYLGEIVFELVTPFMLGSWWALVPGGVAAAFFIVRTALEDRTLCQELDGYQEYAGQVRHRLVPYVW
jgi:protein-S-isoprenylcysteine O-methyltransferase Ste14